MPTTTRSSEPHRGRRRLARDLGGYQRRGSLALTLARTTILALPLLGGCVSTPPEQFFQLTPEAPAHRAAQTRYFETRDSSELLSASAAVLQDLGFHIEDTGRELGFLRAAKERSARTSGQMFGRIVFLILSFGYGLMPIDLEQRIAATLVARPTDADATRHEVRIMFYRVVWKGDGAANREYIPPGEQRMEMVRDPYIYQQFFAKLSKAVFLEAFTL